MMKKIEEILINNNKTIIEKGVLQQIDSVENTLQLIYLSKECPKEITSILYNQIGILEMLQEENRK